MTGVTAERLHQYQASEGGCWLWTGSRDAAGYGRIGQRLAHREIYTALVGPIPEGLHIDHLCRTPRCVNPEHLEAVTQAENNRRAAAARSTCRHGHALDGVVKRNGTTPTRYCLTCNRDRATARRAVDGDLRQRALRVLRTRRLQLVRVDATDGAPAHVICRISSPRSACMDTVTLAAGLWSCTCGDNECPHVIAVRLVTGHGAP